MHTGSLTFRAGRSLAAGGLAALRWLAVLAVVLVVGLPLMRVAAGWYVRGTVDLTPPREYAPPSDMGLLAVKGATPEQVTAVRSAAASLRYRFDPRAVSVVLMERDPFALGSQGEYLPYLAIIRIRRSLADIGGTPLRWTFAHEIGHFVDQRYMTDAARKRFRLLRGIPPSIGWQAAGVPWNERPDEDFAEVFATFAVPSPVAPPATAYGRVRDPAAFTSLFRSVGIVFGEGPRPTGWLDSLAREAQLLRDTLAEPAILRPLLVIVAVYLAMGALPAFARSWKSSAEVEGVPHEDRLDRTTARVLNTPRLETHTGRSPHVTRQGRHNGSGG